MIAGPTKLFRDPGTFFHTKMGEYILHSGQLPYRDFFSFTFNGESWIAQQWLGECIMALIHKVTGLDGLLLATATILAGLYAGIAHRLIRSGLHFMLATMLVVFTLAASAFHFHVRPHIFSILFLCFIFCRLTDFEAGRIRCSRLFWIVPIFVVWANIHGGVLGGLGTLAFVIFGWSAARILKLESPINDYRQMLILWGLLFSCILTIFINPYGLELPKAWMAIMRSSVMSHIIQEHIPAFQTKGGWVILFLGFFYLLSLIGVLPKVPRITWLIPLLWFFLALSRIRHAPLFAIVSAIALANLFPHVKWAKWLVKRGSKLFRLSTAIEGSKIRFSGLFPTIFIIAAIFLEVVSVKFPLLGREWVKLDKNYWPIEILPELRAIEKSSPVGTPIFNDLVFGGFLIYYAPRLQVFIDDRCELYGDKWLLSYVKGEASQFEDWAVRYGFKLALTQNGSRYDKYLKKANGWTIVRQTKPATLYKKSYSP